MVWRPRVQRPDWLKVPSGGRLALPSRRLAVVADQPGTEDQPQPADQPTPSGVPVCAPDRDVTVAAAPATREGPLFHRPKHDRRPLVAQPAIAMRARKHVATITVGFVCAVLGAAGVVLASATLLRLTDSSRLWPAVANAAAVICALIALMQWRLWKLALREWEGIKDVGLGNWMNVSASGVWICVLGALITPVAVQHVVSESTSAEPAWWLAIVGGCLVILGVALAGVHRLHPQGPRGVPPLIRRNQRPGRTSQVVVEPAKGPVEENESPEENEAPA